MKLRAKPLAMAAARRGIGVGGLNQDEIGAGLRRDGDVADRSLLSEPFQPTDRATRAATAWVWTRRAWSATVRSSGLDGELPVSACSASERADSDLGGGAVPRCLGAVIGVRSRGDQHDDRDDAPTPPPQRSEGRSDVEGLGGGDYVQLALPVGAKQLKVSERLSVRRRFGSPCILRLSSRAAYQLGDSLRQHREQQPPMALVVTPDFPPDHGGIQLLMGRVVTHFQNIAPMVVTRRALSGDGNRPPGSILRTRLARGRVSLAEMNVRSLLAALAHHPQVVLAGHITATPAAAAVRRAFGCPMVSYLYADEVSCSPAAIAVGDEQSQPRQSPSAGIPKGWPSNTGPEGSGWS